MRRRRSVRDGMGQWAVIEVGALSLPETWWFDDDPADAAKTPFWASCLGAATQVGLTILILAGIGLTAVGSFGCFGSCMMDADATRVGLKNLEDALALYEIKVGQAAPDIEVLTAWVTLRSPILQEPLKDAWGELLTYDPRSGCVGSNGEDRTQGTSDDLRRCPLIPRDQRSSSVARERLRPRP